MKFTRRGLLQSLLALPFVRAPKLRDVELTDALPVRTEPVDFFDMVESDAHICSVLDEGSWASMTVKRGSITLGERVTISLFGEHQFVGRVVQLSMSLKHPGADDVELEDDMRWNMRRELLKVRHNG